MEAVHGSEFKRFKGSWRRGWAVTARDLWQWGMTNDDCGMTTGENEC